MKKKDLFLELKEELVVLGVLRMYRLNDILELVDSYPYIFTDINLDESFYKLIEIVKTNDSSLNKIFNYVNDLEVSGESFLMEDLTYLYDMIKENYELQDFFLNNIVMYILVNEGLITENIDEKLKDYQDCDLCCYNQVMINNDILLKELKLERRNKIE